MKQTMILIGFGANLPSEKFGAPQKTLEAALEELESRGVRVVKRSRWYSSAAQPVSDQPRYLNAVVSVETELPPEALLDLLHVIEHDHHRPLGAHMFKQMQQHGVSRLRPPQAT